jgi:hypothetical protein
VNIDVSSEGVTEYSFELTDLTDTVSEIFEEKKVAAGIPSENSKESKIFEIEHSPNIRALKEAAIVGHWHHGPGLASAYSERFIFGADYNFVYLRNQFDDVNREFGYAGTWRIEGDNMVLSITKKSMMVGGVIVPPDTIHSYHIEGETLQIFDLSIREHISFPLRRIEYSDYYDYVYYGFESVPKEPIQSEKLYDVEYPFKMEIYGKTYWKFSSTGEVGLEYEKDEQGEETNRLKDWQPQVSEEVRSHWTMEENGDIDEAYMDLLHKAALYGVWNSDRELTDDTNIIRFGNSYRFRMNEKEGVGLISGYWELNGNELILKADEETIDVVHISNIMFDENFSNDSNSAIKVYIDGVEYWKDAWYLNP